MKRINLYIVILFFSTPVFCGELERILNKVDRLYRSDTSKSEIQMLVKNPNWERTLEMTVWTKGMEKTFITINSPKKDKGISTLKRGNEMWNFFPKINKVIKIPPSMMMGSWMGSDFTNDDLVKENTLIEEYTSKFGAGNEKEFHIILIPKKETVTVWGKVELWISKESLFPVRQEFFDDNGKKMRVMSWSKIVQFGDRKLPSTMTLIPLNKKDHETVIIYKSLIFNPKLKKGTFTRKNLQKRR
jgi:outer membrane lipoprotein-sorting protein